MGKTLREQLEIEIRPTRDALVESGELSGAAYDRLLQPVNTTNMARKALDGAMLEPAVEAAAVEFGNDPPTRARLLDALAQCYQALAMPERALELARRSLELRRAHLADDDPELARSFEVRVLQGAAQPYLLGIGGSDTEPTLVGSRTFWQALALGRGRARRSRHLRHGPADGGALTGLPGPALARPGAGQRPPRRLSSSARMSISHSTRSPSRTVRV